MGEASDDEVRALVAYEYVEQLRQGVTFIADDGLAQGRAPGAAAAMDDVGIRGVVNAHDQAVDLVGSDPARYLAPLLDEDDLTETSLRAVVAFAERFDSARLAAHCLETQARRHRVFAEFGRSSVEVFAEAGLLRRGTGADASALDVLGWATAGGQQAYDYSDRGRVEPGAAADLVLLDMARLTPVVDRPGLSTAAYAVLADTRPSCVRHVLVGGRPVLTDGDPALVDAGAIARKRHDLVARVGGGT